MKSAGNKRIEWPWKLHICQGYAITHYGDVARYLAMHDVEYLFEFSRYISGFIGIETHVFKIKDVKFKDKVVKIVDEKDVVEC